MALDGVSLEVADGEVVGMIGANGAGKTTLLKAISRTVDSVGTIELDGVNLAERRGHETPRLGIAHVPEGRRLFPRLPVEDNLAIGAYASHPPTPEDYERVYELFPRLRVVPPEPMGADMTDRSCWLPSVVILDLEGSCMHCIQ